ncbi:hypothetical protein [Paenibacillus sp. YYML68]|uniref:hypothetical protein n=1 Tax=Paenibacillus sp. YYML68 TaxID=2909250 RepID=UPI00249354AC|nr:hypothetical protein [Paenibacillus sp. YYML68]
MSKDVTKLLRHTLRKQGFVDLPAQGYSMFPAIRQGRVCRFVPFEESECSPGDVMLYANDSHQLVAHRYYGTRRIDHTTLYVLKGDSNLYPDEAVHAHQIIGKLQRMAAEEHGLGRWLSPLFGGSLWCKLVMHAPPVTRWLHRYVHRRRLLQAGGETP